jgi:hypothetical protein
MTTSIAPSQVTIALRRAVGRGMLAPSIHNTQPWRFVLADDALEIHADPIRRLSVVDPRGRQLMLSCGCALFNVRVSLEAAGYAVSVLRLPDPSRPELVARVTVTPLAQAGSAELGVLDQVIDGRRTNRRQFTGEVVPDSLLVLLVDAARQEHAELLPVVRDEDRDAVARLSQHAQEIENIDPGYRAELRAWTSDDPHRTDGVQSESVPHVDGGSRDELPIRDFDTRGTGRLPVETKSSSAQCLLLLGTKSDEPQAWLHAGEALERVLLEIARHDWAASPFTQVIEVSQTNLALRDELRLSMRPHVLLRVGRAADTPPTPRRHVADVVDER